MKDQGPPEIRIDLPVDAHLPDDYIPEQQLRLEAYRRLATTSPTTRSTTSPRSGRTVSGLSPTRRGRSSPIAHLRVEAMRVGLTEIVKLRNEVRLAPVDLAASQEVRLQRLAPRAVLRAGELFVPAPARSPAAALAEFIRTMWPLDPRG